MPRGWMRCWRIMAEELRAQSVSDNVDAGWLIDASRIICPQTRNASSEMLPFLHHFSGADRNFTTTVAAASTPAVTIILSRATRHFEFR